MKKLFKGSHLMASIIWMLFILVGIYMLIWEQGDGGGLVLFTGLAVAIVHYFMANRNTP